MPKLEEVDYIKETLTTQNIASHEERIYTAHPDVDIIIRKGILDKWISKQPLYAQDGLNRIKKSGTTQEVIGMFNCYDGNTISVC